MWRCFIGGVGVLSCFARMGGDVEKVIRVVVMRKEYCENVVLKYKRNLSYIMEI